VLRVRGLECFDAAAWSAAPAYSYWSGPYGTRAAWRMRAYAQKESGSAVRVLRRSACHGRNDATTLTHESSVVRITCVDLEGDALWYSARYPRD
jgi:hypothetical protein